MEFRIADSFIKALSKLTAQKQSAVKVTVFDLQQDPSAPGLKFHRVDKSKDPNFWSIRANSDIRVIIHKTADSFLVCYTDHHEHAYKWAERRRIEMHPKTGAAQIVEVRERVEEIAVPVYAKPQPVSAAEARVAFLPPLFLRLSKDDLLSVGVPEEWLDDVHNSSEDNFFDLSDHIPDEAAEALLDYAATGILRRPGAVEPGGSPFDHPDAQRRFRVLDDEEELERALAYPWDQWTIFLHPSQRRVVSQKFNGPARVSGSAGTGKTVVAVHRTAAVLKNEARAKVLLTTFSSPARQCA